MKKYWLLLEAYTFVWINDSNALFYNALSGKHCIVPLCKEVDLIVRELLKEENCYCIELTGKDIQHPNVSLFIETLRNDFLGDLYPQELCPQKPLVVSPCVSINEDFSNTIENSNNLELFGQKVLNNLDTVTIQLTGKCESQCQFCNTIYKQTLWCSKKDKELDFEHLQTMLRQIEAAHIPNVNFIGGNLFKYSHIEELLQSLQSYSFGKTFYLNLTNIKDYNYFQHIGKSTKIRLCVNKDFQEKDILESKSINIAEVEYIFIVTSTTDFEFVNTIIDRHQLNASIVPFYIGSNIEFFEKFVYMDIDDINGLYNDKKDIFANQRLNTNFFGNIFIASDGLVYTNANDLPIGNIRDKLSKLIYHEMKDGKSWFLTRDKLSPCKDCLFRYLCPSPSNYELVIGKPNLCHIKP